MLGVTDKGLIQSKSRVKVESEIRGVEAEALTFLIAFFVLFVFIFFVYPPTLRMAATQSQRHCWPAG